MRRGKSHKWGCKTARWTQNQKLQAVVTYMALGNLKETALVTSVPFDTLKGWRYQDWFKELMVQVRDQDIQELDSKLKRVVDKALATVEDRLDSGDHQYDPKTGKLVRVPVKAHVALKISTELLTKQDKLREAPEKKEIEKTIDDRLARLSEEFQKFAKAKTIEGVATLV